MATIAENLRATLLSLKQISDRVKSLILTSVTKSELNSAKQDVLDAIDEIDIDTSDLAKEATLGDVQDVLEYIEQGGMPEISAIAKQGTNPNATNTAILQAIGTGGGTIYPTIQMTVTTAAIDPNKVYIWGEVASLDISLNAGEAVVANVYFLEFYSGATPATLTLTASVTEIRGQIGSNCIVNVAIYNNIAYIG